MSREYEKALVEERNRRRERRLAEAAEADRLRAVRRARQDGGR